MLEMLSEPLVIGLLMILRYLLPENFFIMSLQSYKVNIQNIEEQVLDHKITAVDGILELRSMAETLIERHKL